MTKKEANEQAEKLNKHQHIYAEVIRILPADIDPPKPGDNGWDVKVIHHYVS